MMKRLLMLLGLLSTAHAEPATVRVQATPSWTIVIPRSFKQLPHEDSWQATGDDRVIYVSSMLVSPGDEPVAATAAKLAAKLLVGKTGATLEYHADGVEGRAGVIQERGGFNLKGFMMTDGRVAVCVISYANPKQQAWAADTWRSLRLDK